MFSIEQAKQLAKQLRTSLEACNQAVTHSTMPAAVIQAWGEIWRARQGGRLQIISDPTHFESASHDSSGLFTRH